MNPTPIDSDHERRAAVKAILAQPSSGRGTCDACLSDDVEIWILNCAPVVGLCACRTCLQETPTP